MPSVELRQAITMTNLGCANVGLSFSTERANRYEIVLLSARSSVGKELQRPMPPVCVYWQRLWCLNAG